MKTILVTSSTGRQGTAAIKSLLNAVTVDVGGQSGPAFNVIAITRNVNSPAAQALKHTGGERLELFECNLDDKDAIKAVFDEVQKRGERVYGVFCVLASGAPGKDTAGEERQGKAVIDCAIDHGVEHFVYSSMERGGEAQDDDCPPSYAAKVTIERYLKSNVPLNTVNIASLNASASEPNLSMRWTIVRPGFFMLNFLGTPGRMTTGILREGLKSQTAVQLVAIEDIGNTVRVVFENSGLYAFRAFTVASQSLTADERDKAYSRAVTPMIKGTNTLATITKKRMPSIPVFLARSLVRWNKSAREMCETLEKTHESHLKNGKGNPAANLETVRSALSRTGMVTFEEFCTRNFPGGRSYIAAPFEEKQGETIEGGRNVSVLSRFRSTP